MSRQEGDYAPTKFHRTPKNDLILMRADFVISMSLSMRNVQINSFQLGQILMTKSVKAVKYQLMSLVHFYDI